MPSPAAAAVAGDNSLTKLLDELAVDILSRLGSLNEAVRCSSLLCKRWRNTWRSIDGGGILDFESPIMFRPANRGLPNQVNQALSCLAHRKKLDALRIYKVRLPRRGTSFVLDRIRVDKQSQRADLTAISRLSSCVDLRMPDQADLSRLEVLELEGVEKISQAAIDHIFSNCPSLRRFALRKFRPQVPGMRLVIRVCSSNSDSNNLQSLDFEVDSFYGIRIQLISAPGLHTFKFHGDFYKQVKFVGDLPRLREVRFAGAERLPAPGQYLPWSSSRARFNKYAPGLQRLGLELGSSHFEPGFALDVV